MKFIKVDKVLDDEQQIYARVDEDGLIRFSCTEDSSEYQAWLNEADSL